MNNKLKLFIFLLATMGCTEKNNQGIQQASLKEFETFFKSYARNESSSGHDYPFRYGIVDNRFFVAKANYGSSCGSGGCDLVLVEIDGSKFKIIDRMPIANDPVCLHGYSDDGYPEFVVWQRGGGAIPHFALELKDGEGYKRIDLPESLSNCTKDKTLLKYHS